MSLFADVLARISIVLCSPVCADRISDCIKVAWRRGCVRNTIVFRSWTSLIVLEWLNQGCDNDLSRDFLNFGAVDFRFEIPFKKCFLCV